MVAALPLGLQVWEAVGDAPGDLVLRWANPAASAQTGFALEDLVGRRVGEIFPAALEEDAWWQPLVMRALVGQEPADFVQPYSDERLAGWFRVNVRPLGGRTGLVSYENITEERERELALAESERLNAAVLASLQEGLLVVDTGGRVTRANHAAAALCGVGLDRLVGALVGEIPITVLQADGRPFPAEAGPAMRALRGETVHGVLAQVVRADGSTLWTEVNSSPLTGDDGAPYGALSTYIDVTDRMARERRMREEADSDPLTGLANRRALERTLQAAIERARRTGREVAVIMLDLDGFKALNDRWGHLAGDSALRDVARRLQRCVRERDLVSRHGGDEFVLVLGDLTPGSTAVVEAQDRMTAALSTPLRFEGGSTTLRAALGVATFPRDGVDPKGLLAHADREMYRSKGR
jgi:diguanylate cyclase (GGDEF)-like protein/PAS domain S-box-containing protein